MKKFFKNVDENWKTYALAGCVCILFFVFISHIGLVLGYIGSFLGIFKTIILGAIIAYIINPLAVFFSTKLFKAVKKPKLNWLLSVVLSIIIVLALITLLMASLVPQVIESVSSLVDNLSDYLANLQESTETLNGKWGIQLGKLLRELVDWLAGDNGVLSKIGSWLKDNLKNIIKTTSNIGSSAANGAIGAIFAVYFLFAKDAFKKNAAKLMKLTMSPLKYFNVMELLKKFHSIFSKYIVCEIIDSLIVGVCNYIFMLVTGMPNILFISVIVALTNLAPTFGPIIGGAIGAFILLLLKPSAVIPFLIFTVVIQTLDGYVIKPKLFGGALNVPGVIILVAIIVFGKLMGVVGMLLAIPFAAIIVYIYSELLIPYLELKKDMDKYNAEIGKE